MTDNISLAFFNTHFTVKDTCWFFKSIKGKFLRKPQLTCLSLVDQMGAPYKRTTNKHCFIAFCMGYKLNQDFSIKNYKLVCACNPQTAIPLPHSQLHIYLHSKIANSKQKVNNFQSSWNNMEL